MFTSLRGVTVSKNRQVAAAHSHALLDQGRLQCFGYRFQAVL